jgi:hypothetical protein
VFLLSLLRDLKRKLDESGHGVTGEDADFCGNLPWLAFVAATSLTCIFALAVFTDDDPVKIAG